jgi:hypothetical protein
MVADIISWTAREASPGDRTVVLRRSRSGHSSRESEEERTNFGSEDHANLMRRASPISGGERRAGRGVWRLLERWLGDAAERSRLRLVAGDGGRLEGARRARPYLQRKGSHRPAGRGPSGTSTAPEKPLPIKGLFRCGILDLCKPAKK